MSDAIAPPVGNELFVHNMRALWRNDPELALRVDAVMDDERFALEPTRSGAWTVKVPTADGATTYLHSRYDPVDEAKRLVDSVSLEDKFCFVVSGMGLGYHIRTLLDRLKGDAFVLCTEPSIEMLATALTCMDLADAIDSRRFVVLTDDDKTRLHNRLQPFNALMMLGAQFFPHPPSVRVAEKAHGVINQAVAEFVTYTRMTLVTLVSNSKITCKNIAMNLVNYVSTPPIDILADRFAGNPGIVISAGPSLSRNIDQLAYLKGRAVLCAVQTAIKPLMKRGIVPDFVTSLDFHEMSQKFFDGAGDMSETHLVAEPKATWHVIDRYPGPVSILGNHWASMVIGDELGGRGGLKAGATVAHLAFYLAVHMGCDPIIFVGQDLAFTGHVFYVPGVEVHQSWRSELNRFNTMEHKEWDRIVRNRPILRRVAAATGGELYTDELLFTYLEQFEKDIADVPRRVVNATEGGAMIRGTESMPLTEAADRFCAEMIDPQRFAYRGDTQWRDPSKLDPTRAELDRRLEELDDVIDLCAELLTLFDELKDLTHDATRFNQRLVRVDELRTKVQQESRAYGLVNSFTQLAELRRFSADRRLGAVDSSDVERAEQQIKRDIEFITGVREGAVELKPILHEARERVREAIDQA
jgi:hypothetical protein